MLPSLVSNRHLIASEKERRLSGSICGLHLDETLPPIWIEGRNVKTGAIAIFLSYPADFAGEISTIDR